MNKLNLEELYIQESGRLLSHRRSLINTRNLSCLLLALTACISFGFPNVSSHLVLALGSMNIFLLQIFEAFIAQWNETSAYRVRLIERNALQPGLDPSLEPEEGWEKKLCESLSNPKPVMNIIEAYTLRLLKGYIFIYLCVDIYWFLKLYLFPSPFGSWAEFLERLRLGVVPGWGWLVFTALFWTSNIVLIVKFLKKYKGKKLDF